MEFIFTLAKRRYVLAAISLTKSYITTSSKAVKVIGNEASNAIIILTLGIFTGNLKTVYVVEDIQSSVEIISIK